MEKKKCTCCEKTLPIESFGIVRANYRRGQCKKCYSELNRTRYAIKMASTKQSKPTRDYSLIPIGYCLCTKCNNVFSLDEFYKYAVYRNGYEGRCKDCHIKAVREWRIQNHEYCVAYKKEWVINHRHKTRIYSRRSYLRRKERQLLTE